MKQEQAIYLEKLKYTIWDIESAQDWLWCRQDADLNIDCAASELIPVLEKLKLALEKVRAMRNEINS